MEYVRRRAAGRVGTRRSSGRFRRRTYRNGYARAGYEAYARSCGGTGFFGILLMLLLSAALVYLLIATPVGAYLLNKLLPAPNSGGATPALPSPAPGIGASATAVPDGAEAMQTETVTLPAVNMYALQIGAYDSVANAQQLIGSLRSLGAAGYCYETDGSVRILAACYADEEQARSVCERLNAQGHACVVLELSSASLSLDVTAPERQRTAVKNAVDSAVKLIGELSSEVIRFDEEEHSAEYGRAIAKEKLEKFRQLRAELDVVSEASGYADIIRRSTDALISKLAFAADSSSDNRVEFSGILKAVQIGAVENYIVLIRELEQHS